MATSWIIGASPDCDIVANQPGVSGRHCRLTRDNRVYSLEDLDSTNGTYVNGTRIGSPTPVTRADAITLGQITPMPWPAEVATPRGVVRIGRDPGNDLVIDAPGVSGRHAVVTWEGRPGEAVIEDLGSANGTAIGAADRKIGRSALHAGDTIYLGSFALPALHVLARFEPGLVPTLLLDGDEAVIGRDPSCHQSIALPMISSRHARLSRSGDRVVIEDLGSANGTFVNACRIDGTIAVAPGDLIGLGSHTVRLAVAPPRPVEARVPALDPIPAGPNILTTIGVPVALFLQAAIVAFAIVALAGKGPGSVASMVWWTGLAALWFGLSDAATVGRFDRLESWSIRLGIAAALGVAQCVVAWSLVAGLGNLPGSWAESLLLLGLGTAAGLALGLLVVALILDPRIAWVGLVAAILLLGLFGWGSGIVANLVPTRWIFEGLLLLHAPEQANGYFPAKTIQMGLRADLMAVGCFAVGLAASAGYVTWAVGPTPRVVPKV